MEERRKRSRDFTDEEIQVLVEGFVSKHDLLSAKYSSVTTSKAKKEAYEAIVRQVNAVGGNNRSIEAIKCRWQVLKKIVKAKYAKLENEKKKDASRGDLGSSHEIVRGNDAVSPS